MDFAQQTTTPSDWILADFAKVDYGAPNGANFTFAKRYDAPYIWSRFYVLFGRIEVVLKAAPGAGIITGAVMMSDDMDEIDWEFSGNNFAGANGKVQTNFFGKGVTGYYDRGTTPAVNAPQDQFHTYALDWSPDALIWSIDGQNVRTLKNTHATSGEYQFPQSPSRLHLGVWCAGDPDNNGATVAWGGGYTNFSQAPFSAYVKSVKVTTPNPCSSWQYPSPFDGTYKSVLCTNQTITNNLPCTYAVVQGDDGYKIAKTLGVAFDALKTANANLNWDTLLVGQALNVPGGNCTMSSSTSSPSATSNRSPSPSSNSTSSTSTVTVVSSTISSITLTSTTSTADNSSAPASSSSPSTSSSSVSTISAVITSSSLNTSVMSSPTPNSASVQLPLPTSYTVVAGDYGYAIATKLGFTFDDLKAANPGLDWDKLQIGQNLNLPGQVSASAASSTQSAASDQTSSQSTTPGAMSASPTGTASDDSTSTTAAASSISAAASSTGHAVDSGSKASSSCPASSSQPGSTPTTAASASNSSDTSGSSSEPVSSENVTVSPTKATTPAMTGPTAPSSPAISTSSAPTTKTAASNTQGTAPSVTPVHSSISSPDKVSPATPASASKMIRNQDNCLRNMIDARYSSSMLAFCSTYSTKGSNAAAVPTFLGGCPKDDKRVSSACTCLVSSFAPPTGTPAITTPALRAGTPSWRLKRSPLRWDRVRA
ncbi:hypothetical protein A1O1_05758 [Capronia coronata CBS 617.96]|uniref:Murein transglycosylase n=1 Tax=Capronia coronata CBS 617.96 TaxID=1182541 RepID=W9YSZ9_9EURO|nr:uncharacterized protein A1O1_05758 [Capronia coronata CBS 617.96]EXJ85394.1 hypothetical protein A1O1_05758 [Capronia coronata CBS 617.96]